MHGHESKSRRAARAELLETRPRTVAAPRGVTRPPCCATDPVTVVQFSSAFQKFLERAAAISLGHWTTPSLRRWTSLASLISLTVSLLSAPLDEEVQLLEEESRVSTPRLTSFSRDPRDGDQGWKCTVDSGDIAWYFRADLKDPRRSYVNGRVK